MWFSDELQTIVPDAKPLSADEVRLGSPNYQMAVPAPQREEDTRAASKTEDRLDGVRRVEVAEVAAPKQPEIVLAAAAPILDAASPAQRPRSCVLLVTHLVRPFTVNQLKELLARTGHLVDGKFWIDKVKSSCLVQVIAVKYKEFILLIQEIEKKS